MTACADKKLLLHALVDGELDAANAAALDAHVANCPGCAAALAELRALHQRIAASDGLGEPAPEALRARIEAALPQPRRRPRGARFAWVGGGALGGALAASLAFALVLPHAGPPPIEDEVVASHLRALLPGRLIDVATSDRHVVKPWFNGRIDFAPPVVDLAPQGFPLVGGRLDYVGGHTVAVLVYRRDRHVISVTVRPASGGWFAGSTRTDQREGYGIRRWRQGDLEYWAISDVDPAALDTFCADFRAASR